MSDVRRTAGCAADNLKKTIAKLESPPVGSVQSGCRLVYPSFEKGDFEMRFVSATIFTRHFAEIQQGVHREPVAVTSHGRVTGYFVSLKDLAELEALREKAAIRPTTR